MRARKDKKHILPSILERGWGMGLLLTLLFLAACHDDDGPDAPDPGPESMVWTVDVLGGGAVETDDEGNVYFERTATFGSLRLKIQGYDAQRDSTVKVTLAEGGEWLTLETDTLGTEGILSLSTTDNNGDSQRTATLVFTAANGEPPLSATLTVRQHSRADADSNGGNAKEDLYVGYGYDIFKALDNPMSVRTKTPIIDLDKLRAAGSAATYEPLHDSRLSRTEMKYIASTSLAVYAEELTSEQTTSSLKLNGCKVDCDLATSLTTSSSSHEQNYGRGAMVKTVASRVIDKAALLHLRELGRTPYSDAFFKRVNSLLTLKDTKPASLAEEVTKTLEEFGTHIVLQADLGGRIDYTFTMEKTGTFYVNDVMKAEIDFTMGRLTESDRTAQSNQAVSSVKNADGAIKVVGGSEATRRQMLYDIARLGKTSQLPPDHVTAWLASIDYDERAIATGDIDVINFELMPIWDLVPSELRLDFLNATLRMAERPDCKVSDEKLGTDLYTIDCTRKDLFDFSNVKDNGSLCRILYLKSGDGEGTPVLQVCSEYVPKIRTDQRVTVAYPIYKRKIRMNEGLFLGDGIHQPAFVGFGNSECFVAPISDLKCTDIIQQICYVNGSLSLSSPGIKFISEDSRNRTVKDDVFYFRSSPVTYCQPIVKIGSNFWTRQDIYYKMGLAVSANNDRTVDVVKDKVLYARFWHDLGRGTATPNKWLWAYDPNTMFDGNPNMKWYFPKGTEVKALHEFLGFNPKALFKGQVSGFNAEFNGYYGGYDIVNKKGTDEVTIRYKGQLNVFATRNTKSDYDATLLVLDKDYRLYEADNGPTGSWCENYYPVRPVRGYMFNYPTLGNIKDFEDKYK